MTVMYGKFEMPKEIKEETKGKKADFARFIVEPLERGFGHTLGNTLRRIMLTALEAPAIVSIRIEGVSHEYMAIEGVVEDMTYIILNLKGALLRFLPSDLSKHSKEPKIITKVLEVTEDQIEKAKGSYKVTLKDLLGPSDFEVINPTLPIFTATKPLKMRIDVRIGMGRGYVPVERQVGYEKVVDEILIDSLFSPVRLVNYFVKNTRVGQDTDYDELILEITTDGRITPVEALSFAAQIAIQHFQVFDYLKMHNLSFDKGEVEANKEKEELLSKLVLKIDEIELSVRSTNCLAGANIKTIGELVVMPKSELLEFRNFGRKSLTEIEQKLEEMGLRLEMEQELNRYGINRENVKTVMQKFLEERQEKEIL